MNSVLEVIQLFNSITASPLSLKANKLIRNGAFRELTALRAEPSAYTCAAEYLKDAQVVSLFRKLPGLPTGIDLRKAALDSFWESEAQCKSSNSRLSFWVNALERGLVSENSDDHRIMDYITKVRGKISEILGPLPKGLELRFGNGSTYGDRGRMITICHKMASHPTVTPKAVAYLDLIRNTAWWRASDKNHVVVQGNRFTTVAKDSDKDRGIAVEPSVNVALQLSVGSVIRTRLKSVGIDINGSSTYEAQLLHRELARVGSASGELATIDLSSASDTISRELVKLLLPRSWFELLNDLRSHSTLVDGKWVACEKFSSMGNGFTFELETLVFYAIVWAVSGWAKVYGDDIIVLTKHYEDVSASLKYFGFTMNPRKSFGSGPFRESCGGDFFDGYDVRPVFLKTMPASPLEWITFHNLIIQASHKMGHYDDDSERLSRMIVRNIPRQYVFYGPFSHEGVIHSHRIERYSVRVTNGIREVRNLQPIPYKYRLEQFPGPVQLASALLGAPSKGVASRNSVTGWKRGWVSW